MKQANVPVVEMIFIVVPTATAQTAGSSDSESKMICQQSLTSVLVSGTTAAES